MVERRTSPSLRGWFGVMASRATEMEEGGITRKLSNLIMTKKNLVEFMVSFSGVD